MAREDDHPLYPDGADPIQIGLVGDLHGNMAAARGLYRAEPSGTATWRGYRLAEPLTIPATPPDWLT